MLSDLRYRLRAMFRRHAMEQELDDELRFHLERETEKHVRAGMSRRQAERRARIDFGGVERIKEDSRDARGLSLLDSLAQDLGYALRGLRTAPGFAAAVILTLGLGVGANAAMFGIVDRLLFRAPPGLVDAETVHRVYFHATVAGRQEVRRDLSIRRYLELVRDTRSFSTMAAFQTRVLAVGVGEASRERPVAVASATFFSFFDARPALGRFFVESDDAVPEGRPVAVLSHAFWVSEFGASPQVIGQRLQVDRMDCTIIGVAPPGFIGIGDQLIPALYVPITAYAFSRNPRYPLTYSWTWPEVVVRRRPGVTVGQATADLSTAYTQSWQKDPRLAIANIRPERISAELAPVQFARGPQAPAESRVAAWLAAVTAVVLLIACANVANLLLLRGLRRRREIALRLALGISRGRLVQQLATETFVLAIAGAACGLLMARWLAAALGGLFLPEAGAAVFTDGRTLLFSAGVALAVAFLTSLVPSVQAGRADVARSLGAGGRDAFASRSRTRRALVLAQSAMCVVLLVAAGLFVRSVQNVRHMRLGYDVDPIVVVNQNARGTPLSDAQGAVLDARLLEEARRIPGVLSASLAEAVPFWSNDQPLLVVDGVDSVANLGVFLQQSASPEYFRTMGTRILRGRAFDHQDGARSQRVMIVGERMAAAIWHREDPIGKCVRYNADTAPCVTVVGVAEEMRQRSLSDAREYSFYIPATQYGTTIGTLFIRVGGQATAQVETIRRRLQALMPGTSYITAVPLSTHVESMTRSWRLGATVFLAFGGLALILAGLGTYSVISYTVAERRREIGVRMALGATRREVVRLVVGSGLSLTAGGVLVGGAIAAVAARWLEPLLFQHSPWDPGVLGVVAAVLIGIGILATAVPALTASRVDPNVILRSD